MELQKQVVSLELAKKLKGLGVKQDSVWCWWHCLGMGIDENCNPIPLEDLGWELIKRETRNVCSQLVPAYTVAELGEMLPRNICKTYLANNGGHCYYNEDERFLRGYEIEFIEHTEADARAKMWLWLKQEGELDKPIKGRELIKETSDGL